MRVEVASFQGAPVLTAGPWAVTPPITIDPSYFSPADVRGAARRLRRRRAGAALAASSRSITSELMPAPGRLPPDWARLEGGKPVPIGSPSDPQATAGVQLRCRAHAGADGRGSGPGRSADRRQGMAGVRCGRTRPTCRSSTTSPVGRSVTSCIPSCSWPRPGRPTPPDNRLPGTVCSTRPRPSTGGSRPTTAPPGWRSAGSCSPRSSSTPAPSSGSLTALANRREHARAEARRRRAVARATWPSRAASRPRAPGARRAAVRAPRAPRR